VDVLRRFADKLDASLAGRSRVITISFQSIDPAKAANTANAIAQAYVVSQLDRKFEATKTANHWLEGQLTVLKQQAETAEAAVEAFRAKNNLVRGKDSALIQQQVSELSTQLAAVQAKRADAEARLKSLRSTDKNGTILEVLNNQLIQSLRTQEATIEQRSVQLAGQYGEKHPALIDARAQLRDIRRKIGEEIDKIVTALRQEVAIDRSQEAALQNDFAARKAEAEQIDRVSVQLNALRSEADSSRQIYESLLSRFKETTLQVGIQQPDASVISRARVPDVPTFPQKRLLLPLAAIAALGVAILIALALETQDQLRSMDEIEEAFGMTALGLVPMVPAARGPTALFRQIVENPTSPFSEAVRMLSIRLDLYHRNKIILVTSALPGEGKTTVITALAGTLALMGKRVLLIDCDLRRPRVHSCVGVALTPGVAECLLGTASPKDALVHDPLTGLYVLPAGAASGNTSNLTLNIDVIRRLLQSLQSGFDLILLDSPPVLAVAEARGLARLADQTLLAAGWGRTTKRTVYRTLKILLDSEAEIGGVLLTMVNPKGHSASGYTDSGLYHSSVRKYYAKP
jgi:capsular exopolysaccharide synthesis family protein